MPTLEWIGKSKVINHHQEVPFRVLERKYSFDESGQHNEDNGSENMIIRGDNLEALKALLPRYEGRIKCIYIETLCGKGNYSADVEEGTYQLLVKIGLAAKNNFNDVESLLNRVVPQNMVVTLLQLYNTHAELGRFTHAQLAAYTHNQLRNEVLKNGE